MEDSDQSEKSISMGPVGMISHDVDAEDSQYYESVPVTAASSVDSSFASPVKNAIPHAMGLLSLSSIPAVDTSITGLAHSLASPEGRFGPDILMSTVINTGNNNPVNICAEDLSISMGPLPPSRITEDEPKVHETSLVANIEKLELKRKLSQISMPKIAESKAIQTEEIHCQKCEQLDICYNQKLIEVATEFQKQYASQFQMAEQHTASLENAQKQINDLMDQLDGADKQIKANRAFLEQQAVEREQEREEASEQQKQLKAALAEKEKECERGKSCVDQLTTDVQHLQDSVKEKEKTVQEQANAIALMEQQLQILRLNQSDLKDENCSLQSVLDVKDKLLKAQAEQIAALEHELENLLYSQSESERESEAHCQEKIRHSTQRQEDGYRGTSRARDDEVPSLFDELQQLIVRLIHKVDSNTRALESAQFTKNQKVTTNNNLLLSPRNFVTPSTSTEDISIKDRNPGTPYDQEDQSITSSTANGQNYPEMALTFLQQLDGKLAVLGRIEEAACKRINDLESELARLSQSEKKSLSKTTELEQQYKQQRQLAQQIESQKNELEAEKREMLAEHTDLLKRISSLENRLEEQRRSAVLGASQNLHAEKCRSLSEEKRELLQVVQEKEECLTKMQDQMNELYQRIDKLMKAAHEHESSSRRHTDFSQSSSIEKLRDDPHRGDGSMMWSRLQVHQSPISISPVYQHRQQKQLTEIPYAVNEELEELKSKMKKSEEQRRTLEDELASRMANLGSLEQRNSALENLLDRTEKEKKELEERCESLEEELKTYQNQGSNVESLEQRNSALESLLDRSEKDKKELEERCSSLEEELRKNQNKIEDLEGIRNRLVKDLEQLRAARESCASLEKKLTDHKQANQAVTEDLRRRCAELETARSNLLQEYDIIRRRCVVLETEAVAQRDTVASVEVLQQRCASLQADLIHQQESAQLECADLKTRLTAKEQMVNELHGKLKASDSCKIQVEEALKQLQLEVDAIKRAQKVKETRPVEPRDLSTLLEGPAAPPDLLAPSFIEFLGSTSSSRCSSRPSSALAHRTTISSPIQDYSLPNSMVGKKVLKDLQKESEELLAFGKQLLELQQKNQQKTERLSTNKLNVEVEDLETTLKPDGVSFNAVPDAQISELQKKVELLEVQLTMERLLLQDQRAANARQQQQLMQLLAKQRNSMSKHKEPKPSSPQLRSLQPGQAGIFIQYRALKLESIRKNLIYQKKFLSGMVSELDQNHNEQQVSSGNRWNVKPSRRFKIAALAIISIGRMRYVVQQWRLRRKMIESQALSNN